MSVTLFQNITDIKKWDEPNTKENQIQTAIFIINQYLNCYSLERKMVYISTRQIIVFCVAGLFLFGWIKIIIYLNSIPGKLLAHPHEAGGGSSSFYSQCVSHLKISTLFAHQQSQKPFRQILNQIKCSNNLQVIIIGDLHSLWTSYIEVDILQSGVAAHSLPSSNI